LVFLVIRLRRALLTRLLQPLGTTNDTCRGGGGGGSLGLGLRLRVFVIIIVGTAKRVVVRVIGDRLLDGSLLGSRSGDSSRGSGLLSLLRSRLRVILALFIGILKRVGI
jgi:hypothetical protein